MPSFLNRQLIWDKINRNFRINWHHTSNELNRYLQNISHQRIYILLLSNTQKKLIPVEGSLLQQIPKNTKNTLREYLQNLHYTTVENLKEMDKFLDSSKAQKKSKRD